VPWPDPLHDAADSSNPLMQALGLPAYDRIEAGHVAAAVDALLAAADRALAQAAGAQMPADYAALALHLDVPI
jgi:oligopeptidase A